MNCVGRWLLVSLFFAPVNIVSGADQNKSADGRNRTKLKAHGSPTIHQATTTNTSSDRDLEGSLSPNGSARKSLIADELRSQSDIKRYATIATRHGAVEKAHTIVKYFGDLLFVWLDADKDGAVSQSEFRSVIEPITFVLISLFIAVLVFIAPLALARQCCSPAVESKTGYAPLPTSDFSVCGSPEIASQSRWTCLSCDEPNRDDRKNCNNCGKERSLLG